MCTPGLSMTSLSISSFNVTSSPCTPSTTSSRVPQASWWILVWLVACFVRCPSFIRSHPTQTLNGPKMMVALQDCCLKFFPILHLFPDHLLVLCYQYIHLLSLHLLLLMKKKKEKVVVIWTLFLVVWWLSTIRSPN